MLPLFPIKTLRRREGLEAKGLCPHCKSLLMNIPRSPYASCSGPCDKARLIPRFSQKEIHALWLSRLPVADLDRDTRKWKLSGHDGWWRVTKTGQGIQAKRQTETRLYIKWFREVP